MRARPAHERDAVDDDGQILRVHRLRGALVRRQLQDVHAEAAQGRHEDGVLLAGRRHVDRGAARLREGMYGENERNSRGFVPLTELQEVSNSLILRLRDPTFLPQGRLHTTLEFIFCLTLYRDALMLQTKLTRDAEETLGKKRRLASCCFPNISGTLATTAWVYLEVMILCLKSVRAGATPSSPSESSLSRHAARGGLSELPFDGMFRTAK